ncbi:MAG TPA: ATP-binding cassette domain-containing protein [Candidatus Babeliales bacterium]|nr:ATP-binding cassette domain-containing protein [Candidatus Babeliales bacterium]
MLQLKNINVWFGSHHILRDISCTVQQGDFIVIVGTNGSGKTSLFNMIAGAIAPDTGSIILDGMDITQLEEYQRAHMITQLFQSTKLNTVGSLTVAQNLAIANYSRRRARLINGMNSMPLSTAQELLQTLKINPTVLDKPMQTLSGGQRQLIAFAMATQLIPKLLLLDEPTAALDPQAATKLLEHTTQFIKKHTLTTLLITHDPHIALSIGNKIWVLEHGRITKQFNLAQKKDLKPEELIGQIDYQKLQQN